MPPSKYLIRALSQPTKVDAELWEKWYIAEHLPDAVNGGVGDRGALFRAYNDFALQTKTPSDSGATDLHGAQLKHFEERPDGMTFLAMYQTKFENYTETEEAKKIRTTSEYFNGEAFFPFADFDVRVYELIQDYNPDELADSEQASFVPPLPG